MQHHARYGRKTGLSSDMAGTAVLDPELPSKAFKSLNLSRVYSLCEANVLRALVAHAKIFRPAR
jgi:hypothetical protein